MLLQHHSLPFLMQVLEGNSFAWRTVQYETTNGVHFNVLTRLASAYKRVHEEGRRPFHVTEFNSTATYKDTERVETSH